MVGGTLEGFLEQIFDAITAPRTREGYYHYTGGIEAAIKRSIAYAPYADLLWLETKSPNVKQASSFARKIKAIHPDK